MNYPKKKNLSIIVPTYNESENICRLLEKISKNVYSQILSLPIYPSISKRQQNIVIHNIEKYGLLRNNSSLQCLRIINLENHRVCLI